MTSRCMKMSSPKGCGRVRDEEESEEEGVHLTLTSFLQTTRWELHKRRRDRSEFGLFEPLILGMCNVSVKMHWRRDGSGGDSWNEDFLVWYPFTVDFIWFQIVTRWYCSVTFLSMSFDITCSTYLLNKSSSHMILWLTQLFSVVC